MPGGTYLGPLAGHSDCVERRKNRVLFVVDRVAMILAPLVARVAPVAGDQMTGGTRLVADQMVIAPA